MSADPPLLLVCVDLESRTLEALRVRGRFVVNFMRQGRGDLCLLFASKADDKFAAVTWRPSPRGLPVLADDALAWAECGAVQEIEAMELSEESTRKIMWDNALKLYPISV